MGALGRARQFRQLYAGFLRIEAAPVAERDHVVKDELDRLAGQRHPVRNAFMTEMLCLRFPDLYPAHNAPVRAFASASGFRARRGSTEGVRYIALATWLRKLFHQAHSVGGYPADNLAELDI